MKYNTFSALWDLGLGVNTLIPFWTSEHCVWVSCDACGDGDDDAVVAVVVAVAVAVVVVVKFGTAYYLLNNVLVM